MPDRVTERGKCLNVWTQVNGSRKIKANMWNADATPSVASLDTTKPIQAP